MASGVTERNRVIDTLRSHADDLRAQGVTHLALFGSMARGEAGPDSDVDVVVQIADPNEFSIIDHGSLRVLLCDILGRETDVVVEGYLRPRFGERIRSEKVQVF